MNGWITEHNIYDFHCLNTIIRYFVVRLVHFPENKEQKHCKVYTGTYKNLQLNKFETEFSKQQLQ